MSIFQSKRFIVSMVAAITATAFGSFFKEIIPPIITPIINHYFPANVQLRQDSPININVPSAFQVNYLYRDANSGSLKPILPGSVLRSGDYYKVLFTPDRNGYVYLFQVDSTGQFFQLFPMSEFNGVKLGNDNPVKAGQRYVLPSEDSSFKLDQIIGRERLFLTVTTRPHGELESLAQKLTEARYQKDAPTINKMNRALVARLEGLDRGLGSMETDQVIKVSWDRAGEVFETLGRKLENLCENCVYGMEFEHK